MTDDERATLDAEIAQGMAGTLWDKGQHGHKNQQKAQEAFANDGWASVRMKPLQKQTQKPSAGTACTSAPCRLGLRAIAAIWIATITDTQSPSQTAYARDGKACV
jgi:hypothetical protein